MKLRFAIWLFDNAPLPQWLAQWIAPWVVGIVIGRKPHRVIEKPEES